MKSKIKEFLITTLLPIFPFFLVGASYALEPPPYTDKVIPEQALAQKLDQAAEAPSQKPVSIQKDIAAHRDSTSQKIQEKYEEGFQVEVSNKPIILVPSVIGLNGLSQALQKGEILGQKGNVDKSIGDSSVFLAIAKELQIPEETKLGGVHRLGSGTFVVPVEAGSVFMSNPDYIMSTPEKKNSPIEFSGKSGALFIVVNFKIPNEDKTAAKPIQAAVLQDKESFIENRGLMEALVPVSHPEDVIRTLGGRKDIRNKFGDLMSLWLSVKDSGLIGTVVDKHTLPMVHTFTIPTTLIEGVSPSRFRQPY